MKRFIERAINLLFIALSGMKTGINGDIFLTDTFATINKPPSTLA
jgi:hypothetical protein